MTASRSERLKRIAGAGAGVLLLLAAWEAVHWRWGPLVLPAPWDAFAALLRMLREGDLVAAAGSTAVNALGGFAAGGLLGTALGLGAGFSPLLGRTLGPMVTVILGVPPVAWVVLALLWFGANGSAALVVVMVTTFPLVFAGAVHGVRTLDPGIADMARSLGAGPRVMILRVYLPHVFSYLFPALTSAHGIAWKAAVMAEVLGAGAGIGERLATARANLDTAEAMGLVVLVVALLLAVDGLILNPLGRHVERWRATGE